MNGTWWAIAKVTRRGRWSWRVTVSERHDTAPPFETDYICWGSRDRAAAYGRRKVRKHQQRRDRRAAAEAAAFTVESED